MGSLNLEEGAAVFTLVDYLLGRPHRSGDSLPTPDEARDALALLADLAYKKYAAGVHGTYVRENWHLRRVADGAPPPADGQTDGKAGS